MARIIITGTGAENSLGCLLGNRLVAAGNKVAGWTINPHGESRYKEIAVDVTNEMNVKVAATVSYEHLEGPCDILINNVGRTRLDYLENLSVENWDMVMDTNTKGYFLPSKHLLEQLASTKGTILNIGSTAGKTPMTTSLVYNASKAAVDMMTLQMARELGRKHGVTVFGISPGKIIGTPMSKTIEEDVCRTRGWGSTEAKEYQLASLASGKEIDPDHLVSFITYLLQYKERHQYFAGCIIPYGSQGTL